MQSPVPGARQTAGSWVGTGTMMGESPAAPHDKRSRTGCASRRDRRYRRENAAEVKAHLGPRWQLLAVAAA